MEFYDLGKRCAQHDCRQLDFLPFTCRACEQVFCLEHHKFKDHECKEAYKFDTVVPSCPVCTQPVTSRAGEAPDVAMERHLSDGSCPGHVVETPSSPTKPKLCQLAGCKDRNTIVPITCKDCGQQFCVKHRHPHDHRCQPAAAREAAEKQRSRERAQAAETRAKAAGASTGTSTGPGRARSGSRSRRSKVNPALLMKKKMNAVGNKSLPRDQRFWIDVYYPVADQIHNQMFFFPKATSVGKVIDVVTQHAGLENNNNRTDSVSWHLFSDATSEMLANDAVLELLELCGNLKNEAAVVLHRGEHLSPRHSPVRDSPGRSAIVSSA